MKDNKSEIIIYQTEDGTTRVNVNLCKNSVWLSLNDLAELFQRDKSVISRHIKNISTCAIRIIHRLHRLHRLSKR